MRDLKRGDATREVLYKTGGWLKGQQEHARAFSFRSWTGISSHPPSSLLSWVGGHGGHPPTLGRAARPPGRRSVLSEGRAWGRKNEEVADAEAAVDSESEVAFPRSSGVHTGESELKKRGIDSFWQNQYPSLSGAMYGAGVEELRNLSA